MPFDKPFQFDTQGTENTIQSLQRKREEKLALLAKTKPGVVGGTLKDYSTIDANADALYGSLGLGRDITQGSGYFGNEIDNLQASLYQAGGGLYDAAIDGYNRISDTPTTKDNQFWDNMSNPQLANKQAGYDPSYDQAQMKIAQQQVNDGDYGNALLTYGRNAGSLLASSAGASAEILGGAALTAGLGFIAPELGIATAVGTALSKVPLAGKLVTQLAKWGKNGVVYAADNTNKIAEEYQRNTGKQMSSTDLVTNYAAQSILAGIDFSMMGKAISSGTVKPFVDTMVGLKNVAKLSKSDLVALSEQVLKTAKNASIAGGGEMVQEYLQQWSEILGKDSKSFIEQFNNMDNRNQTVGGALAGLAMGGVPGLASGAVGVGTNAVASGVKNTTAIGIKKLADKAKRDSFAFLSEEDRQLARETFKAQVEVYKAFKAETESKISLIQNAKSLEDITDKVVSEEINKYLDDNNILNEDLTNPNVFKSLQNNLISGYNAQITYAKTTLEANRVKDISKKVYNTTKRNVVEKTKEVAQKLGVDEKVDQAIVVSKKVGKAIVDTTINLQSSVTIGIARDASQKAKDGKEYSWNESRKIIKKLRDSDISISDLETLKETVVSSQPTLARGITNIINMKNKAKETLGIDTKTVMTKVDSNSLITKAGKNSVISSAEAKVLASELLTAQSSKINDLSVLKQVQVALEQYKRSGDTTISKRSLNVITKKLDATAAKLTSNTETAKRAINNATSSILETSKKIYKVSKGPSKAFYERTLNKIDELVSNYSKSKDGSSKISENAKTLLAKLRRGEEVTKEDFTDYQEYLALNKGILDPLNKWLDRVYDEQQNPKLKYTRLRKELKDAKAKADKLSEEQIKEAEIAITTIKEQIDSSDDLSYLLSQFDTTEINAIIESGDYTEITQELEIADATEVVQEYIEYMKSMNADYKQDSEKGTFTEDIDGENVIMTDEEFLAQAKEDNIDICKG